LRHIAGLETPAIRYATQQQRDWRRNLNAYDTSARLFIEYIGTNIKWRESVPLVIILQLTIGYLICASKFSSQSFAVIRRVPVRFCVAAGPPVSCKGRSINVDESVLFTSDTAIYPMCVQSIHNASYPKFRAHINYQYYWQQRYILLGWFVGLSGWSQPRCRLETQLDWNSRFNIDTILYTFLDGSFNVLYSLNGLFAVHCVSTIKF
jgi:hypothetical protein